jgi:hypothetical protein
MSAALAVAQTRDFVTMKMKLRMKLNGQDMLPGYYAKFAFSAAQPMLPTLAAALASNYQTRLSRYKKTRPGAWLPN